jgi:hypothetical protein
MGELNEVGMHRGTKHEVCSLSRWRRIATGLKWSVVVEGTEKLANCLTTLFK